MAKRLVGASDASREKFPRYNLVTGEDTYAQQNAQNPATSRVLQSWIPSLAGDLQRELADPTYLNDVGSPIGYLYEFDQVNPTNGVVNRYFFACTATQVLLNVAGVWTAQTLPLPSGTTTTSPLNGYPQASTINNLMHLGDGTNSWLFDGTDWVLEGMPLPTVPPVVAVSSNPSATVQYVTRQSGVSSLTTTFTPEIGNPTDGFSIGSSIVVSGLTNSSFNGDFVITGFVIVNISSTNYLQIQYSQVGEPDDLGYNADSGTVAIPGMNIPTNRYYWTTWLDQTEYRGEEQSDCTDISAGTGTVTNGTLNVFQRPGTIQCSNTSPTVTAVGAPFVNGDVGMALYTNGSLVGIIESVAAGGATATLWANAAVSSGGSAYVVAPVRATHWVLYASESDNSQIGMQLAIIPVTQSSYPDSSPFLGTAGSLFEQIERPIRNDPPVLSKIQTVHKYRIFRRREIKPNYFNYTANEEVSGNENGSPQECTPGTDPNTLSDLVNEQLYPDGSAQIRGICSHGEACYFGSERNIIPLYGQTYTDFQMSQLVAFKVGVAGRYAMISCPQGLAFVSYDRKVYLYPSNLPPIDVDATSSLIELSRPKRPTFEKMLASDLDNVRLQYYNFGRRNWLVLCYQDTSNDYHTWVYDFEIQGWFQLQRGVVSLAVFEVSTGNRVLLGGDAGGQVWVLDDLTGTFSSSGNLPAATFRTALINWNNPGHYHVFKYLEFEVDNVNLGLSSITVSYWLDPVSVDSPGPPTGTLNMSQVQGSNFFRGFPENGGLCYRLLIEIAALSDQNSGGLRGINMVANEASGLIF